MKKRETLNFLKAKTYHFLRWGEKYTKTDNIYLTKGGFWLTLGHGVAVLAGLVLTIGFANLLSKESFGTYKFILSLAGILSSFSLTGLSSVITRSVARGFEGSLKIGFLANLKWSFVVFVGGFAGALYYFLNDNLIVSLSILIAGSLSPFMASASLYGSFLEGKKDFRRQTFYGMGRNIFPAASILTTIFFTDSPLLIILVYFVSNTLVTLLLYYRILKVYKPSEESESTTISYGKHLSLMNVISTISNQIDKVLVFHFLGAAPLAIYTFAIAPVDQLQAGKKFVRILALPKLSSRTAEELKISIPQKAKVFFLFSALVSVTYILLAPLFYKFIFPQYIGSVFFSQIYALVLLFSPAMLFVETLVAHQKKKELYIINTGAPVLRIILYVILLPLYGIMGLILALVFVKLLSTTLTIFLFKKSL